MEVLITMFDMIPFVSSRPYKSTASWDPFQEFFGTVAHAAATDIRESDDAFVIETELPGYDKGEIAISMKEGVLTVKAEHKAEGKDDGKGYIRRERSFSTVERRFEVSGVDAGAIQAQYVNGVLKLTLPKLPEVVPQQYQIEIQ